MADSSTGTQKTLVACNHLVEEVSTQKNKRTEAFHRDTNVNLKNLRLEFKTGIIYAIK